MLRIGRLPALMIPECRLAWCITLGLQAFLAHIGCNCLDLFIELLDAGGQFFQVQMSLTVDQIRLLEHATHVALEFVIFVNFTVAKLLNGL